MALLTPSLNSAFLGDRSGIRISNAPTSRSRIFWKPVTCKESRVGKRPIEVPSNVTIDLDGKYLKAKGPLGELSIKYPSEVKVERNEAGYLKVTKTEETKRAGAMHGLFRTLTSNMVVGVSEGFEKRLEVSGVGYRAAMEGKDLVLYLGFSHPVKMAVPDGLQVKVEDNNVIVVSGYDKCAIGLFAAAIKRQRPPEPYKGKGIRYAGEYVERKEGKAGKKK